MTSYQSQLSSDSSPRTPNGDLSLQHDVNLIERLASKGGEDGGSLSAS